MILQYSYLLFFTNKNLFFIYNTPLIFFYIYIFLVLNNLIKLFYPKLVYLNNILFYKKLCTVLETNQKIIFIYNKQRVQ